ncbi:MAG: sodium:solute symporter [Puniceicoccaceae bacterium]
MPVLGYVFSKLNTNLSDFVRGGGQGTWWLVGSSILMSGISAFTFTGNASAAFEAGPTVLIIYAANVVALGLGAWFLGAWFRQTRAYTRTDVVRLRFGVAIEQFNAYTVVALNPIAASIQLWALAVFANSIFGIPVPVGIIVIGLIVIFYSTTGGKWAVMATDFAQSLILFSITILVAVLSIIKIGGFGEFFSFFGDPRFAEDFKFIKDPGAFPTDRFTMKWIIVIFLMSIYQQIALTSADRYLTVRDGKEARKSAALAAVLMAFGAMIWFIPPMVARFLYQDEILAQSVENPANTSYAYIAQQVLPNGLMGVMIAAMFSATMSSMDSGLNAQVGVIARNIVPALRRLFGITKEMSDRSSLIMCRFLTLMLGLLIMTYSILFTLNKELILFDAYLMVNSIIGIPLGFPLVVGLWIKHIPRWSFFWIFGVCLVPSIYSFYLNFAHDIQWTIQYRAMWIFIFGFVGTAVSLPFYRYSSKEFKELTETFFKTMHTPVDFLKEIGVSKNYQQLVILSRTSIGIGLSMLLFLLVPNSLGGRISILFVGGFCLTVGGLLHWGSRVEKRKSERDSERLASLENENVAE